MLNFCQQDQYYNLFYSIDNIEHEVVIQHNGDDFSIYIENCETGDLVIECDGSYDDLLSILNYKIPRGLSYKVPGEKLLIKVFDKFCELKD